MRGFPPLRCPGPVTGLERWTRDSSQGHEGPRELVARGLLVSPTGGGGAPGQGSRTCDQTHRESV